MQPAPVPVETPLAAGYRSTTCTRPPCAPMIHMNSLSRVRQRHRSSAPQRRNQKRVAAEVLINCESDAREGLAFSFSWCLCFCRYGYVDRQLAVSVECVKVHWEATKLDSRNCLASRRFSARVWTNVASAVTFPPSATAGNFWSACH